MIQKELFDDDLQVRVGKFELSEKIIYDEPGTAFRIMREMIIMRAEFMLHKGCIEYIAMSRLFEKIEKGYEAPEYEIKVEFGKVIAEKSFGSIKGEIIA